MGETNSEKAAEHLEQLRLAAFAKTEEDTAWWNEQWLAFPTISRDQEGLWHYWDVPEDSGVYNEDWQTGEGLARDTVAQMQAFMAGRTALRRILRDMDFESTVGQGFLTRLEDMLANPEIYLGSLEPGAVRSKLKELAETG
ncbi:MAG: hypothetical protein AAF495_24710 [Pseudomonadota bacterium]